jgi:hypothetical protein
LIRNHANGWDDDKFGARRGLHLSALDHGDGTLMSRLCGLGVQPPVQRLELSQRQDTKEQAAQQTRHHLALARSLIPSFLLRVHYRVSNSAVFVREGNGDSCKSLARPPLAGHQQT